MWTTMRRLAGAVRRWRVRRSVWFLTRRRWAYQRRAGLVIRALRVSLDAAYHELELERNAKGVLASERDQLAEIIARDRSRVLAETAQAASRRARAIASSRPLPPEAQWADTE